MLNPTDMRLQNIRHEKFAQGIAEGKTAAAAYVEAGFSPNAAAQGAERLNRNSLVASRIAELRIETEKIIEMNREDYVRELQIRFTNLPAEDTVTARYGEMLAKAMGWNEPEKHEIRRGDEDPWKRLMREIRDGHSGEK
jgi:phage terminase small subunit